FREFRRDVLPFHHRTTRELRVDLGIGHPEEVCQHFPGMLPDGGRTAPDCGWRARKPERGVGDGEAIPSRAFDLLEHLSRLDLAMLRGLRDRVQRATREAYRLELREPLVRRALDQGLIQDRLKLCVVLRAVS